jgi:hypothetical protein
LGRLSEAIQGTAQSNLAIQSGPFDLAMTQIFRPDLLNPWQILTERNENPHPAEIKRLGVCFSKKDITPRFPVVKTLNRRSFTVNLFVTKRLHICLKIAVIVE